MVSKPQKTPRYTTRSFEVKQLRFNKPMAELASRFALRRSLRNLACLVIDADGGHTTRELIDHSIPPYTITAFTRSAHDYSLIPDTELGIEKLHAEACKLYSEPLNFNATSVVIHDGQQSGKNTLCAVKELFKHNIISLGLGCNVSTRAKDLSHKRFSAQLTQAAKKAGYVRLREEKIRRYRQLDDRGVTMQPFWFEFIKTA